MIPEPSDQIGHRKRRGSRGVRPVHFDSQAYKGRSSVERSFKQWRAIATRYDKLAITYRLEWSSMPSLSGYSNKEIRRKCR